MKNKRKILLLLLFNLFVLTMFSQTTVSGHVLTSENNLPLAGVNILVKGVAVGAITDFDGAYKITIPGEANTLVFSYVGFVTQEIKLKGTATINCVLMPESNTLDEVILIGYGTTKKKSITGAISSISNEVIEDRPIARVEQALYGQMAGVQVRATSGAPGAPLQIAIRGKTSVSADNTPLYVVDGFPAEDISDIVASDIASINVLKDAAQAAIYGSRGANGVVIITTKSGKKGDTKFRFNSYFGLQTVERKVDMLSANEWIDLTTEVINNNWVDLGVRRGLDYKATDSYEYRLGELGNVDTKRMADPRWATGKGLTYLDWQDELFRIAKIQQYQIAASGGSDKMSYYLSGSYLEQEGIVKYTDYSKLNFRSNFNIKFNKKLSLNFSMSPTISHSNGGRVTGKDASVHKALAMVPIVEEDTGIETGVQPYGTYQYAGSTVSPVAYLRELYQVNEDLRVRTNMALKYEFIDNLIASLEGGYSGRSTKDHRYIPTKALNKNTGLSPGEKSDAYVSTRRDNKYLVQGTLSYNKNFGNHEMSAVVGFSSESRNNDRTYQRHKLFSNDILTTFSHNTSTVNQSYYEEYEDKLHSYFGRVNYSFADRYLLSGSIRRDGSSRFGKDNLWGSFPAFSAGWRIDKEAFMSKVKAIRMLKLRYGYGETGNNRIPYYQSFGNITSSNYAFNDEINYGSVLGTIENSDLGWEKTLSSNYGLDLGLYRNRIFLSLDYYVKETSGMLYNVPVPLTTGFSNGWTNIGRMKNKGWEVELTTKNLVHDFKWKTSINVSHNENIVEALGPDNTPILAGFQGKTQILKIGEPLYAFYMYDVIGVYKNQDEVDNLPTMENTIPGDIKYRDVNGDGKIDVEDRTIVGDPSPDLIWGITNSFKYKFLELSVLLQGQIGGEIYGILGRAIDKPNGGTTTNRPAHWKYRWRSEENPGNGIVPRIDGTTASLYDSRWLYDATYWKIKNITLTVNLPHSFIKGIKKAKVYFSGENLFMVDHYDIGFSPEADNNDGGDYGGYPLSRVITLGLNLQF